MVDGHLHETLSRRIESFASYHVLDRADRTCDLIMSLLRREGGLAVADGVARVGGRPVTQFQDLIDDVARASGVTVALYSGEWPLVSSRPGLAGVGVGQSLPREVLTVCQMRREVFSGSVDFGDKNVLVVGKPIAQQGNAAAVILCGVTTAEASSAFLGLASIEEDIVSLADRAQAERQRAVADFLKIIRSIAKRIHLLALNASILSAQAGEQGRGFAVVAREIGELAERTRQSTQELETEFAGRDAQIDAADRRSGGRSPHLGP
jgi:hypothetical protein